MMKETITARREPTGKSGDGSEGDLQSRFRAWHILMQKTFGGDEQRYNDALFSAARKKEKREPLSEEEERAVALKQKHLEIGEGASQSSPSGPEETSFRDELDKV